MARRGPGAPIRTATHRDLPTIIAPLTSGTEVVDRRSDRRGSGPGRMLLTRAIDRARGRGCALVQLPGDKRRTRAHHFCSSPGFVQRHVGDKLPLHRAQAGCSEGVPALSTARR